ncbi:MAG: hypothetical protein BZY80_05125, partial [SAR202 cluster bacterium Io17-Chloro-G2]
MATSIVRGKYVIVRAGSDAGSTTVIADGAVFQRDGVIENVGAYSAIKAAHDADQELGGDGYLVFPGLVNCHHHGRGVSTFQMGTCDDSLETWMLAGWGRRPYDHYLMTAYTAIQMLESGTTTVMYNHPQTPVAGLQEDIAQIIRGFSDSGMRTAFSVYFRERNRVVYADDQEFISGLPRDLSDGLNRYLAAIDMTIQEYFAMFQAVRDKYETGPGGKVRVLLSPSNVQWVSDEFLQQTKELATQLHTGIHMHLVESFYQKEYGNRHWGKTPVAHLNDLGFLGPELSCAHGVWLTRQDIDLLAQSQTTVCHNASSNLRLKNGIAPVNDMLAAGINVAMGTDSTALNDDDDMIQEMRLVSKLHRQPGVGQPGLTSQGSLAMATANAARPTCFHQEVGVLEKGYRADMVLLDLKSIEEPYFDPDLDPVDALLYRGKAGQVDTVIVDGEVVLKGGKPTKVNKDEIVRELKARFSAPLDPQTRETRAMVSGL